MTMSKIFLIILLVNLAEAEEIEYEYSTDKRTGKEYVAMTFSGPTSMDYLASADLCSQTGGYLPEPKDIQENQFVANLTTSRIYLGMSDKQQNGVWKWNSDNTTVAWFNWEKSKQGNRPNHNKCVIILKTGRTQHGDPYNLDTWAGVPCDVPVSTVVCELKEKCWKHMQQCYMNEGSSAQLITPNAPQLCAARDRIRRCWDGVVCDSTDSSQNKTKILNLYEAIIREICSITGVNWEDWENTTTSTCKNNDALKQETMAKILGCYDDNNFLGIEANAVCGKLNDTLRCLVNDVPPVCGPPPYSDYIRQVERAQARAHMATTLREYTLPPYSCRYTIP